MNPSPTIRAELEQYLKREGLSKTEFGHITGMNPGTVSGVIIGNRSISVNQLDRITAGMNLPPDHFYDRYVEECIEESPLNWRKIGPFLRRCVKLNRLDCLQRVVYISLDNVIYPPLLFKVAEESFKDGYNEAAAFLYTKVAENEKQQHAERLAVCQYRLFKITVGKDQAINLGVAARFEPFVKRLSEVDQLDALKDLANIYRSMGCWDKVYEFALELRRLGKIQYDLNQKTDHREQEPHRKPSSGPLFAYIAYADLLCANACDAKGDYEQGLEHISAYANLKWVKEQDPDTLHWIGLFQRWAKINTYVNRIMSGDISVLPDYVEHISGEQHIFAELLNVIEAANRYDIDVDHVLQRFEPQIAAYREQTFDAFTQQIMLEQAVRFWYKLAKYNLFKGRYSNGFKSLIDALEISATINNVLLISNCSGLFNRFRAYAAPETLAQFDKKYQEVWEKNDKKDGYSFGNN